MEKIAKSIILTIVGIILAYIVIVNFGSVLITLAIAVGAFIVLILLKTFVFDSVHNSSFSISVCYNVD